MMKPKVIRTEADHEAALARIEEIFDARPGTPEGDELDLLTTLVEVYENEAFPIDLPDPLTAIRFRMEQQGLKAKDLVPFIGSPSKVSEILSGKRRLSVSMIRELSIGLDIPAEVLVGVDPRRPAPLDDVICWRQFPWTEMIRRRWFPGFNGTLAQARDRLEDLLAEFVAPLGGQALQPALNRQHVRGRDRQSAHALLAWRIRVASLAMNESLPSYEAGSVKREFLSELAHLSYLDTGPRLAKEFLNKAGIHLVIERHLSGTHLDGAAFKLPDGSPVVALTLRHDRLDNFWFTLFHELAHVSLHLDADDVKTFFDDLANKGTDSWERGADQFAADGLIPSTQWKSSKLSAQSTTQQVRTFAAELRISPAIPAGRIRYETKNWRLFSGLVGRGQVRRVLGA